MEWETAFQRRLREVQGTRSQEQMATILCISRDAWNKYVNRKGSALPIKLLPQLAALAGKDIEWLINGNERPQKAKKPTNKRKTTAA